MGAAAPLVAIQTGVGLWSSFQQSSAIKAKGKAEEMLANENARLMEAQAQDAILRGDTEAAKVLRQGRFIKGSQRAGFAGQGVAVDTGTPAAIQEETDTMSSFDALTVKNNAWRESFGYKSEATRERFRGRLSRLESNNEARNTLLTGGLNAVNDIGRGFYLNNQFKNTSKSSGFKPRNPTEAKFNSGYKSKRS